MNQSDKDTKGSTAVCTLKKTWSQNSTPKVDDMDARNKVHDFIICCFYSFLSVNFLSLSLLDALFVGFFFVAIAVLQAN